MQALPYATPSELARYDVGGGGYGGSASLPAQSIQNGGLPPSFVPPSPAFPLHHPEPPDPEADELLKRLQRRRAEAQAAEAAAAEQRRHVHPTRAPAFIGDLANMSAAGGSVVSEAYSLQASQLAPTRPASPSMSARLPQPELHPGDLPKEVAARDVELRVLRTEVEAREVEGGRLRDQVSEAELKLQQASGIVGTLSAKVEATSGNRHAVLEASAQQIDSQVSGLRRRLARTEWELSEKDDEIATLRKAIEVGTRRVEEQRRSLMSLQKSHADYQEQADRHEEDISRLHRHKAIGEWRERVHTHISREQQDSGLIAERRERERWIHALDEDVATFKAFTARMEEKMRHHVEQTQRLQQTFDNLVMEERLCFSAANLGQETAKEQKQYQLEEHRTLEARIQEEIARKAARAQQAETYDRMEAEATCNQVELASLIECTREVTRTLQNPVQNRFHTSHGGLMPQSTLRSQVPMSTMSMPLQVGAAPVLKI